MAGFGTQTIADLVRTSNQNIIDFGERQLFDYVQLYLDAHNSITADQLAALADSTTERILGYGGTSGVQMVETDEFGRADASKPTFGGNIGLPMRLYQASLQWTRKWMENHTPQEAMAMVEDAALADTQQRQKAIKTALFGSSNYSFKDHLIDRYTLSVKALANNDSFGYPPDPYGNAVAGSHNHYLATASLTATNVDSLVATVAEHYNRGKVVLLINSAQESTVRGFNSTGQFLAKQPVTSDLGANAAVAVGALDTTQVNNRSIGYWGNQAAEVWVKPWIPSGYILCLMMNTGKKVLGYRTRRADSGGLTLAADDEAYPLRAQTMDAEYGFGVVDRLGGAVMYTGGGSYVDPTF